MSTIKKYDGISSDERKELEPIYLLFDERMLKHRPNGWVEPDVFPENIDECDDDYPMENPERLRVIYDRLCYVEERLMDEYADEYDHYHETDAIFKPLLCEMATKEQILMVHSETQYQRFERLQYYSDAQLAAMSAEKRHDVYYCRDTFDAAKLAAGGLLSCVDSVCDAASMGSKTNKAVALIRPPGHHACQSQEMGFCFIDSVVVAAKHAIATERAKRVVILDWDIHDGNGTSEGTIDDENIFRIDIHRYNPREGFYPFTGAPNDVGSGKARGLNLNMAWSHAEMGNTEYAAAFYELILPLLADFQPDLLLISCGLDAALGDLLGGCELTPDFFHAMTRAALEAVGPHTPVVCALEGGYTMSVIPDCMEAVTLAMLNCPYQLHSSLQLGSYLGGAAQETRRSPWPSNTLERSRRVLSKYYIRDGCSRIIESAIRDINTCIRVFSGISRWNHLHLHRLKGPPVKQQPKKRKWLASAAGNPFTGIPFQRPRVYLWYGTELHHQRMW